MARYRMIKPEFWEDDKIAECSANARLLFIALWNFADDEGYLEYRLKWLKAKCLPYDNIDIADLLGELEKVGRIIIQGNVIWVKNFLKHQKIDKPSASVLSQIFKDSANTPRMVADDSRLARVQEDKTKQDKTSKVKTSKDDEVSENSFSQEPEKKEFGKEEINLVLQFLRKTFGLEDFKESKQWQRNFGQNLVSLMKKIGREEFGRRLELLAADSFRRKNCNSLKFVYGELKSTPVTDGLIQPKSKVAYIISDEAEA